MRLIPLIKHLIHTELAAFQASTGFITSQLTESAGNDGMGTVTAIDESATIGKTITVSINGTSTSGLIPGPDPLVVGQSVTVSGGKVFG